MQKERYYMECQLADCILSPEVSSVIDGNISIIGGAVRNRIISAEKSHEYYADTTSTMKSQSQKFSMKEHHPQTAARLLPIRDIDVLISDTNVAEADPAKLFAEVAKMFNSISTESLSILSVKRVSEMTYLTPISRVQATAVFHRATFSYRYNGGLSSGGDTITMTVDAIYFPKDVEEFFREAIVRADAIAMFPSGEIRAFGYGRPTPLYTFPGNISRALELREYINDLLDNRTQINVSKLIVSEKYNVGEHDLKFSFVSFIYKMLRRSSLGMYFENLNLEVVAKTLGTPVEHMDTRDNVGYEFTHTLEGSPLHMNSSEYFVCIGGNINICAQEFIDHLYENVVRVPVTKEEDPRESRFTPWSAGDFTYGIRVHGGRIYTIYN